MPDPADKENTLRHLTYNTWVYTRIVDKIIVVIVKGIVETIRNLGQTDFGPKNYQ